MEEKLFNNWNFIYENSEDISLHVEYVQEGEKEAVFVQDVSTKQLKEKVGSEQTYHIEILGSFQLVIHAIKDDFVYVSFHKRTSEYGWQKAEQFVLHKRASCKMSNIEYFGKPSGFYIIYVKEWGGLKNKIYI